MYFKNVFTSPGPGETAFLSLKERGRESLGMPDRKKLIGAFYRMTFAQRQEGSPKWGEGVRADLDGHVSVSA